MSGYSYLGKPSTRCVHFSQSIHVSSEDHDIIDDFVKNGGIYKKINYLDTRVEGFIFSLSSAINGGDPSGGIFPSLVDDLINISENNRSLAITVLNSSDGFKDLDMDIFLTIEAFNLECIRWLEKNKTCNIVFHF